MTTLKLLKRFSSLTFVLLNLKLLAAFNLAYNKIVWDCRGNTLSNKLVDGNVSYENVEIVTTECVSEVFVRIDLQGNFIVNYVIVYEGRGATPGQLDYFIVKLANVRHEESTFEFDQQSYGSSGGMRVNVDMASNFVIYVQIQLQSSLHIHLSEVEVHSMVPTTSNERPLAYRGCFYEFSTSHSSYKNGSIFEQCKIDCLGIPKDFLAIKVNQCFCGNFIIDRSEVALSSCQRCPEGDAFCGSELTYSVYIARFILPVYFGCFSMFIQGGQFQSISRGNMTIDFCIRYCERERFSSLINGTTCLCQDYIEGTREDRNECQLRCSGDNRQFCGSATHFAAYRSCVFCSNIYKCEEQFDRFGDCAGRCRVRYLGENCFSMISISTPTFIPITQEESRITQTTPEKSRSITALEPIFIDLCQISNPCIDVPLTYCVVFRGVTICECLVGYSRNRNTNKCEDLDECVFEPCDVKSSTCTNLNGSYDCECLIGFFKIEDSSCIANDSDENDMMRRRQPSDAVFLFLFPAIGLMLFIITFFCLFKREDLSSAVSPSLSEISRFDKRSAD